MPTADGRDTAVDIDRVRHRWSDRFELLGVDVCIVDLHQVAVTLRRR